MNFRAVLILAATLLANGCSDSIPTRADGALTPATERSLTTWFREHWAQQPAAPEGTLDDSAVTAADAGASAPSKGSFSSTILQETGVDEADLVKSDGERIYAIYRNEPADFLFPGDDTGVATTGSTRPANGAGEQGIRIMRTIPGETGLEELSRLKFDRDQGRLEGLYLMPRRLIALSASSGYYALDWFRPISFARRHTDVHWIDIDDPANAGVSHHLSFDGALVASRRIDDTLYLMLRHFPDVTVAPLAETGDAQTALETLTAADFLPGARLDDQPAQPAVAPEDCYLNEAAANGGVDVITLVAVDVASKSPRFRATCYVGSSETLYASTRAVYIASTRWDYRIEGDIALYDPRVTTDIHKFALDGLKIEYRGSAEIGGHLGYQQDRKPFRMSESADGRYFRVLTYNEQRPWLADARTTGENAADSSPVMLTVLREATDRAALETVARLPNAAQPEPLGLPGERLYASRFIGDRAYLVTYRITDPLYILDLSDALQPRLAGALKVDGYSDFLQPVGENLLLGVGKDAIADPDNPSGFRGGAWYQGVKLSLIDVADPGHPRETDRLIIGKRGTESAALRDHHALALLPDPDTGATRLALPVELHDKPIGPDEGPRTWYGYTHSGLYRFEIDAASETIAALPPLVTRRDGDNSPPVNANDDRAVLIGDTVHYLPGGQFWSQDWPGTAPPLGPQ
ncbi:MAG TPA: hypothetical protein ENK26_08835 [Gammaproteobacteria bacterium]|nr:hypothetical protein [Gammaproteobacteria bacterium]